MPCCPASAWPSARRWEHPMPEVTLVEAVNLALARALEEDPSVVVLGQDVGVNGGVFRATVALQQRFGPERVIDTPLAELLISGLCVGMAAQGLRPVGEIQFMGFLYPCIDQLVNHASRLRHRTLDQEIFTSGSTTSSSEDVSMPTLTVMSKSTRGKPNLIGKFGMMPESICVVVSSRKDGSPVPWSCALRTVPAS